MPNFIKPDAIELVVAYCLFSFFTSGVILIAIGLIPVDITRVVAATKVVPCSDIASKPFNTALLFQKPL